jgi:hypothetical protein
MCATQISLRPAIIFRNGIGLYKGDSLKSAVFWVITQHKVVNPYRRFETTYRSRYKLRNNQEERESNQLVFSDESLKPRDSVL